jgi:hypothetical protein
VISQDKLSPAVKRKHDRREHIMADTVESLRADLNILRDEFNAFKKKADPVVQSHQPTPKAMRDRLWLMAKSPYTPRP